jgi:xanthine dehydrogenase small subunit
MFHDNPEQDIARADIDLGLAGNLCRCTGYAPIVRAAQKSLRADRRDQFTDNEKNTAELLQSIKPSESLQTGQAGRQFFSPRSVDELCVLLKEHPEAVMVAGATDVGLWVNKQMQTLETIIYLGAVSELQVLEDDGESLKIGAAVSYTDSMQAIAAHYPAFLPLIERLGASQVRNAGTVGGNIANGSPIGDMPPGLIAAGSSLVLRGSEGQRVIDLENFFIAYGKQDLREGEFVEQILLPVPQANRIFASYKISKRIEQDISAVCGAFSVQIDAGTITDARICYGGMAEIPKRAGNCEKILIGKAWQQESIELAMESMQSDFSPISDMRASANYRLQVAKNLLQRFYLEHSETPYPVRIGKQPVMEYSDV